MTRLCFVCTGNIVRSPLAEHYFRQLAEKNNRVDQYQVESAGTISYHVGESPDDRMLRVARSHGLVYSGRAIQFRPQDFDRFDLILAMDRENLSSLLKLARSPEERKKVRMLRDFDPLGRPGASVPDPYYEELEGFEEVYQVITRSCRGLFEALENQDRESRHENP